MTPILYDYQEKLVDQLREAIRTQQVPVLLWAPCGAGKGTLATYMIQRAAANGLRVLFLVNRRGLVHDQSRRLDRLGLDHGIIMAGVSRRKPWLNVHIASIDTLHRRETLPPADLIFIDECHFSVSPTWKSIISRYAGVPLIGMSATPARLDGRGLGEIYKKIILGPSTRWLIDHGKLSPTRVFAPTTPDVSGVKIQHGEYNQKQLATVMDRKPLIGDIVDHWKRLGRGRPTILFAVNRKHAQHCREQFSAAGIRAEYADGEMPDSERDALWARLARYETEIACTVGIVSYGWDVPEVACAIDVKPTESLTDWLQRVGRIQRTAPGKINAVYLDHAGNTSRFGFSDDDRSWDLAGAKRCARTDRDPALAVRMCQQCWAAFASTAAVCPHCGWQYQTKTKAPEVIEGELQEITAASAGRPVYTIRHLSANPEIARLQKIAAERGYKPGWVWGEIQRLREKRAKAIQAGAPQRARGLFEAAV